ncbi:MAG: RNA polymerase sigma factor [Candidatus Coatesbacteria bacterium]|nr:RNA polymerase sigma factor [Candidatus Coatesbacteria bacterium]
MAVMNGTEVDEIVERAQHGDNEAFEQLFARFGKALFTTIVRIVGDVDSAEELLQEAFLRIYRKLSTFDKRSSFYTWAYRIAVNMSLNYLKSKASRKETQLEPELWDSIPAPDVTEKDAVFLQEATRVAIQKIPPRQRAVLVMRVYDGMDYAEVAKTLGCSQGAAKANFHFAMQKLKKHLKEYE